VQLEQRAVALAVRVGGAHHDDDEVEEERRPAHHEHPEQDGEGQGPSRAAAPSPPTPTLPAADGGQGRDLPGVDARQHEHVDVEEADDRQGDDEEDDEEDHDELGGEEAHHEHGGHAARRPDDGQRGLGAPHRHDVVVAEGVEDGDVTGGKQIIVYI